MNIEYHDLLVWITKAELYPLNKGGDFPEDNKYFYYWSSWGKERGGLWTRKGESSLFGLKGS